MKMTMKKKRTMMATTDLCSLSMLIPQWKTMKKKIRMKKGNQMSPLMILAGSFLRHGEVATQKRRGCSSSRCYRTTTNFVPNL